MKWSVSVLVIVGVVLWLALWSTPLVRANGTTTSTPTPSPTPFVPPMPADTLAPGGDPSTGDAGPSEAPLPTPTPGRTDVPPPGVPTGSPDPVGVPPADAGPVTIIVRICVDMNNDGQCASDEAVYGMPFALLAADTGDVLAQSTTAWDGRRSVSLTLDRQTPLVIDVPILGITQPAYGTGRGVTVIVPGMVLPEVIP